MDGYKNKKPDVSWWLAQIESGKKWKEEISNCEHWPKYRRYYRNEWADGIMPKNIFFSMRRTIVPRVYFRNPSISIIPATPGAEAIAHARIIERIDNQLIRKIGLKQEMQKMVDAGFITGTVIGKLGYGSKYAPTPELDGTIQPVNKDGERVEFSEKIKDNEPWFKFLPAENFIVARGSSSLDDSFFTAELHKRPWDELIADPRFPKITQKTITPKTDSFNEESFDENVERPTIDIWEIRDRRSRKVMMIGPNLSDKDKLLHYTEDEFQNEGGINYFSFAFNPDDENFWTVSDATLLEPIQLELNELHTKMMHHRRMNMVKLMVEEGAMDAIEAQKMTEEDVGSIIMVKDLNGIQQMKILSIPPEMMQQEQMLMQDARELIGFSRNAFGDFSGGSADRTATEVQAVKQAAEIRIDERRDKLADVLVGIINGMNNIIFKHWTTEQVIDVVGENRAKVWVKFTGKELSKRRISVEVDPDSSVPQTKAIREQNAIQAYQLLGQDPDINRKELLKILIKELGVTYMQILPETAEGADPISIGQYSNQIGSINQAMNSGSPEGGSPAQGGQNSQSVSNQVFAGAGGNA